MINWETKITKITESKYPIIMGAFAHIGTGSFAAAFSNAGGFGILTASNYTPEEFKNELKLAKRLTNQPFGVNFSIVPSEMIEKNPRLRNEDYYIDGDYVNLAIKEGIRVFSTSGYHVKKLGKHIHELNGHWFHKCALISHAIKAEKDGADAVTLVGIEGAGAKNPYQNTTLVNITMGKKILKIPLIAAGGIGDGSGFLAALMMGAEAVCFGTAIIVSKECPALESYKSKILNQNIFAEDFHKKIFNYDYRDITIGSMASGHIDKIVSINEFIQNIISDSEKAYNKFY